MESPSIAQKIKDATEAWRSANAEYLAADLAYQEARRMETNASNARNAAAKAEYAAFKALTDLRSQNTLKEYRGTPVPD